MVSTIPPITVHIPLGTVKTVPYCVSVYITLHSTLFRGIGDAAPYIHHVILNGVKDILMSLLHSGFFAALRMT